MAAWKMPRSGQSDDRRTFKRDAISSSFVTCSDTHRIEALVAAGCSKDLRAGAPHDLNRRLANAASRRVNQDALAGLQTHQMFQSVQRGKKE